jgi:serine/threonine protein kinase
LQQIALGIANGIKYLQQGCDESILHFDINPHNVLIDNSFTPKITDFGLAKMYSKNQSIVSMTEARGTLGYMAPTSFLEISEVSLISLIYITMVCCCYRLRFGKDVLEKSTYCIYDCSQRNIRIHGTWNLIMLTQIILLILIIALNFFQIDNFDYGGVLLQIIKTNAHNFFDKNKKLTHWCLNSTTASYKKNH